MQGSAKMVTYFKENLIKIEGNRILIEYANGVFINYGIFYYDRIDTKKYHKENLTHKDNIFLCKQLIGMNSEIPKYLYTRIINLYIKGVKNGRCY